MTQFVENDDTKLNTVGDAYNEMIAEYKLVKLIHFIQTRLNLKISFNERKDVSEDLRCAQYNNNFSQSQIIIECRGLLDATRRTDLLGLIAQRFCHYAMFAIYNNGGKPYGIKDEANRESFLKISETFLDNYGLKINALK